MPLCFSSLFALDSIKSFISIMDINLPAANVSECVSLALRRSLIYDLVSLSISNCVSAGSVSVILLI